VDAVTLLLEGSRVGSKMREGLRVVILGPPNCGKSTLLNRLAREEVAIVSDSPGTTRDLLRVSLDLGGLPVEFVDTAGLRDDAQEEVEVEGMKRALSVLNSADLVVLMSCVGESFDPPVPSTAKTLRLFNKIDAHPDYARLEKGELFISALTGQGVEAFVSSVFSAFGVGSGIEVPVLARRRHVEGLEKSLDLLFSSLSLLDSGGDLVLVAEDLKEAQNQLGFITRPLTSDELLGHIFSEFCIGK
jgi:tRNA modification GTPase